MITLAQARRLAQEWSGYKVSDAGDCGDKWVFGFEEFKECLGGFVVLTDKKNGGCKAVSSAEFMYALLDGEITFISVDLPEEEQ